jgi:peptidyl-prolyl cis-trans isomerase C
MLEVGIAKRLMMLLSVAVVIVGASSCQDSADGDGPAAGELFGDGLPDGTPVICKVNGYEITHRDLEMRMEDLPSSLKRRFSGEDWERRLLEYMIGEVILAQDAEQAGLRHESAVSRQLINLERTTLRDAYTSLVLWEDLEPSEQDIANYYEENKATYYTQGNIKVRHIQCDTRHDIDQAWEQLQGDGYDNLFANVAGKFSNNSESVSRNGELGWFSRGGFISAIPYGDEFSKHIYDWDIGLHPPEYIGEHWHIIEILKREPSRQLTINEVRDRIVDALTPSVRQSAVDAYVAQRRGEIDLELFGDYRPGHGRTAEELLSLGMLANTPERQEELYNLLLLDYPDSEYAPMALFMKANLFLDTTGDKYRARQALNKLLRVYPDAEIAEQAQYMLDNLAQADFHTPASIDELRELAH